MLIQLEENNARILLNGAFYGINAVIAANTLFQEIFSTEVSFTLAYVGTSPYHTVILTPKRGKEEIEQKAVHAYVNAVLHQQMDIEKKNGVLVR